MLNHSIENATEGVEVALITDGAYSSKTKVGGWGCILVHGERRLDLSGWEADSSNNRMELRAVIEGLKALRHPTSVRIICDSKYVIDGSMIWIHAWLKGGWINSVGQPVKNQELWEELIALLDLHQVEWQHIKGHNGHKLNSLADKLAVAARVEGAACEK